MIRATRQRVDLAKAVIADVGVIFGAATAVHKGYKKILGLRAAQAAKGMYVVTLDDSQEIWADVQLALLDLLPAPDQRVLAVRVNRNVDRPPITPIYQGAKPHQVTIAGHKVTVSVFDGKSSGQPKNNGSGDAPVDADPDARLSTLMENWGSKEQTAQFDCPTIEARDAVIEWLSSLAEARRRSEHPPRFWTVGRYSGWNLISDVTTRPLSTVVLPHGQIETLVRRIETFQDNRDAYARAGRAYHLGILLHGIPGVGKTSVFHGLASHFGLDLYHLPLGDVTSDGALTDYVTGIKSGGGMLILEDVDVFKRVTQRDGDPGRFTATLSGLLNMIDGIATPSGLIIGMTSNDKGSLDPALFRAGRVDVDMEIGALVDGQADGLYEMMFQRPCPQPFASVADLVITAADITGAFVEHIDKPDEAWKAGADLIAVHREAFYKGVEIARPEPEPRWQPAADDSPFAAVLDSTI